MEHLQLKDPKQVLTQSGFPEASLPLGLPHFGQGTPPPKKKKPFSHRRGQEQPPPAREQAEAV